MSRQKIIEALESNKNGERNMGEIYFKRFTFNQLAEHWAMIGTFMLLVISGMPLKFPDAWWSPVIINFLGGFAMRTQIHHAAGIGMVILGVYHVVYHVFVDKESLLDRKVWPTLKDAKDFWQTIMFYIGKAQAPKYGRYSWKEKFDYWGAFWGMVMLCVTGLIMLYPFQAMEVIPYATCIFPLSFIQMRHYWLRCLFLLSIGGMFIIALKYSPCQKHGLQATCQRNR